MRVLTICLNFRQISYFPLTCEKNIWRYAKIIKWKLSAKTVSKKLKWCSSLPLFRACWLFWAWCIIWCVSQQIMLTFVITRNFKNFKRFKTLLKWNIRQLRKIVSDRILQFRRTEKFTGTLKGNSMFNQILQFNNYVFFQNLNLFSVHLNWKYLIFSE